MVIKSSCWTIKKFNNLAHQQFSRCLRYKIIPFNNITKLLSLFALIFICIVVYFLFFYKPVLLVMFVHYLLLWDASDWVSNKNVYYVIIITIITNNVITIAVFPVWDSMTTTLTHTWNTSSPPPTENWLWNKMENFSSVTVWHIRQTTTVLQATW